MRALIPWRRLGPVGTAPLIALLLFACAMLLSAFRKDVTTSRGVHDRASLLVGERPLEDLFGGTYHLRVRETYPDLDNAGQIRLASRGILTHPADGMTDMWFTVDRQGQIVALRSRVSVLPDLREWSETSYRGDSSKLLLEHYSACKAQEITLPSRSLKDLFLEVGGPWGAPEAFGFEPSKDEPSVFTAKDETRQYSLQRAEGFPGQIYTQAGLEDRKPVVIQSEALLAAAEPDAPGKAIGRLPCWDGRSQLDVEDPTKGGGTDQSR
jgi:hypothetical protein